MLLAHDLGTTGAKVSLYAADGSLVGSAVGPYPTSYAEGSRAEQNAEDWWRAVCETTRRLLEAHPEAQSQLAAVGLCGMMNGCLLVNDHGDPLRPALIHADIRSGDQCRRIAHIVGDERASQITGNRLEPYFTIGKLAWLAENEPELVDSARWCLQAKDFVGGRLTSAWGITDRSDASLTGCFDIAAGSWSDEMINAAGIRRTLLPSVAPSSTVIGKVSAEAAAATGLPWGLPVVVGGGDGACATAGAGAVRPGAVYHYLGSSSWIGAVTEGYQPDPSRRISVLCGLPAEQCVLYGTVQSAGACVDWVRSLIGFGDRPFAEFEAAAASAPAGSRGLVFLPYLMGERSPLWDATARGVFFGLSPTHGPGELARSVLEGVAFALRSNLDALADLGYAPQQVRALGGGMRSRLWREILTAVYQRPLLPLQSLSEASSAGAAVAAGVGVELFPDYATAVEMVARPGEPTVVNDEAVRVYEKMRPLFRDLYESLRPCFAANAAAQSAS